MRILVLDGQAGGGRIALVERADVGLRCLHEADTQDRPTVARGGSERLARLLSHLLDAARWAPGSFGLIAVVTGPGSFTGLRATLALAHGFALGTASPLLGVSAPEALRRTRRSASPDDTGALPLWCVALARRDRVFLDRDDEQGPLACMLDELPIPDTPVLLAGDASALVAAHIAQRGGVASCSLIERPDAVAIAAVAIDRLESRLGPCPTLPLYVDRPEAKLPASGLRPAPVR